MIPKIIHYVWLGKGEKMTESNSVLKVGKNIFLTTK